MRLCYNRSIKTAGFSSTSMHIEERLAPNAVRFVRSNNAQTYPGQGTAISRLLSRLLLQVLNLARTKWKRFAEVINYQEGEKVVTKRLFGGGGLSFVELRTPAKWYNTGLILLQSILILAD